VLLAGDAAHIHFPAGGQGLNLGLQDAANLGWKLAGAVRGCPPDGLLDSYYPERSPIALDVIADSQAQCALFANPTPAGIALRDRFDALLGAHESLRRDLALRLSGLAVRYDGPSSPPASDPAGAVAGVAAVGCRMPDLALRGAPAGSVFGLLRPAKFVLLVLSRTAWSPPGQEVLAGYRDRLIVVDAELAGAGPGWAGVRALLIRPDGHLAWVLRDSDGGDDGDGDGRAAAEPPLAVWLGASHA
jgi:hypothetical protein